MVDSDLSRRRDVLATVGAVSTAGCLGSRIDDIMRRDSQSGSWPDDDWQLVVDEQWESFDTDRWGVGFIDREEWIPDDDAAVREENVTITDGVCELLVESEGTGPDGCFQGVINSTTGEEPHHPAAGIPIDPVPGQYVEARLKLPGRTGILPAFWMHPANMNWPPEIDIVELFQRGEETSSERQHLHVNVHWSESGTPNDRETHTDDPFSLDTSIDLTESFNTYGCAWFEDRIEWYFNENHILTRTTPPAMIQSLTALESRPFGLVFSNHVNRIGQANLTEQWRERLAIDWVRVWEQDAQ